MKGRINKLKGSNGDYIYPITVSDAVYVDPTTSLKDKFLELSKVMGKVLGSYVLDLSRWELNNTSVDYNDKKIAKANSIGINAAIQWASGQGYSEIIFPLGTYLLDEYSAIIPSSYMTLNLGGAKLRIRNNGYSNYHIIDIKNQVNVRIMNGSIEGDREYHDYSSGGTHEGSMGVNIGSNSVVDNLGNPEYIILDNLEVYNCTGDSIGVGMTPNFQSGYNMSAWEQGSINLTNGTLLTDTTKIRIANKIMLNKPDMIKYGYFSICGNGWGDFGSQINTTVCDVIFYNSSDAYVSSLKTVNFFEDVPIPSGAAYAKVVLYQSNIPVTSVSDSVVLSIGVPLYPRNVFIEKCNLHHSRRCGISAGGKYIYISNNKIHDIYGTPPQAAIDIEDGYGLNQFYIIEGNHLYDCKLGISLVYTQHVIFSKNVMDRLGPSQIWNECIDIIIDSNHVLRSGFTLDGEVIFTNNVLHLCEISSRNSTECVIGNNYFHNSSLNLTKTLPHKVSVNNCHFYHDADSSLISNQQPTIFYGKEPQTISNCVFEGKTSAANTFSGQDDAYEWQLINNTFINTKSLTLPAGSIRGCVFDNSMTFGLLKNSVYDFVDCLFKNWDSNNNLFFLAATDNMELIRIRNCKFIGKNKPAIYLRNIQGRLEIINNLFEYKVATTSFNIIDFLTSTFTCQYLIVDGNEFVSNQPLTAVNLNRQITTNKIFFRNNILDTVIQPITSDIVFTSNNYINGVLEPFKSIVTVPTTGKYLLGHTFNKAVPIAGGNVGWVCTTAGYACGSLWSSSGSSSGYYNKGDRITSNSRVYEVITPGNPGATKPNFTGSPGEQVQDNTVTWKEIGALAIFKEYGLISNN
ncbi:hypothetical protein AB4114_12790 [Paenibacillus sp. 2RAB27]|uniref:hypothetical protein n=1 Tax=Paenibacillus sp. 2RAB27 TaxID=3232991 RepID=UPI003F9E16CB